MAKPRSPHCNPFGISEVDPHFDELLAEAAAGDVGGEVNMTKALEWLKAWNSQAMRDCKHLFDFHFDLDAYICVECGKVVPQLVYHVGYEYDSGMIPDRVTEGKIPPCCQTILHIHGATEGSYTCSCGFHKVIVRWNKDPLTFDDVYDHYIWEEYDYANRKWPTGPLQGEDEKKAPKTSGGPSAENVSGFEGVALSDLLPPQGKFRVVVFDTTESGPESLSTRQDFDTLEAAIEAGSSNPGTLMEIQLMGQTFSKVYVFDSKGECHLEVGCY